MTGEVERDGVRAGRHVVGVGDDVVTLRNDRHLVTSRGAWVRNGDRWKVTRRFADGALELAHATGQGAIRLPASYVAEHLSLGYALTVHKAQGTTVDEAVVVVNRKMTAEQLYVAMSRGRDQNQAVVVCQAPETEHGRFATPSPAEVLVRSGAMERNEAPPMSYAVNSSARSSSSDRVIAVTSQTTGRVARSSSLLPPALSSTAADAGRHRAGAVTAVAPGDDESLGPARWMGSGATPEALHWEGPRERQERQ